MPKHHARTHMYTQDTGATLLDAGDELVGVPCVVLDGVLGGGTCVRGREVGREVGRESASARREPAVIFWQANGGVGTRDSPHFIDDTPQSTKLRVCGCGGGGGGGDAGDEAPRLILLTPAYAYGLNI